MHILILVRGGPCLISTVLRLPNDYYFLKVPNKARGFATLILRFNGHNIEVDRF